MTGTLHKNIRRLACSFLLAGTGIVSAVPNRPFPQAGQVTGFGLRPNQLTQAQLNAAVSNCYFHWKTNYLAPSTKVAGDYKVNYDGTGQTVSEAMGYGMLLTVYLAGADPDARACFDGLDRFRKRYPSNINPGLMCWKIPANESAVSDDCATDGDLDMAFALLLAHQQWGDMNYFYEAMNLLGSIRTSLVRPDYSLRLGDWNSAAGQTRPSDFMPASFRSFYEATRDAFWTNVENTCYLILDQLQTNYAAATGLVPDFSTNNGVTWKPARANFLESAHDGEYYYNACRVPWRIGWAACQCNHPQARQVMARFMTWAVAHCTNAANFKAGYKLDGSNASGNNYDTACFISPTGVAAMVTTNQPWLNETFAYAMNRRENYYEDSVSLLSMLVMSGNAWVITAPPRITQSDFDLNAGLTLAGTGSAEQPYRALAATNLLLPWSNWTVVATGRFNGGFFNFTDTQTAAHPSRFYRVTTP